MYYILAFFATFMDSSQMKTAARAWSFLISGISVAIIIIGMFLTWTGVGAIVAEGVQGRYFIPIVFHRQNKLGHCCSRINDQSYVIIR